MVTDIFSYLFAIFIGLVWSIFVIGGEILLLFKYKGSYFSSPTTLNYPKCVTNSKYGKSKFIQIETTKGSELEKTKLKLHYVECGSENVPVILFLHGFPEFWYSWRYQMEEFSKTHRVFAIDMRGYGLSDKPLHVKDYQMKHLINDVKGFLNALEIPSVTLVSHDWGGIVAWTFENVYPEMVEKFVALNIPEPSAFQKMRKRSWQQFFKSWYVFVFQIPFLPEWMLSRFDMKGIANCFRSGKMGLKKEKLSREDIDAYKANMAPRGNLTAAINYYRAIFRYTPKMKNLKPNNRSEKNRYMLIFGECDGALCVETARETKNIIPNLILHLLPGLSHWVQQDDPVLVNKLIRDFI